VSIDRLLSFVGESRIGVFGAGRVGRALALLLLEAGLPAERLALCHRGSPETRMKLAAIGLADRLSDPDVLLRESRLVLFTVRPQDFASIEEHPARGDAFLVSFLAGVPLARLPSGTGAGRRARILPSAPDTLLRRRGIAALFPAGNDVTTALLEALGTRVFPLEREEQIDAFGVLASCLPIALAHWERSGRVADERELVELAARYDLPDYASILAWAHDIRESLRVDAARSHHLAEAATPGGVTEELLRSIDAGRSLPHALMRAIDRSRELGRI
jgi:pyrroline-5-carboxylate reductase